MLTETQAQFPQPVMLSDRRVRVSSDPSQPRWFAVFTNSHHEKRVHQCLVERHVDSFLPLYSTVRRRPNRCKVSLELPLFPNYLFVQIRRSERGCVLGIPGVLAIVGKGRDPEPLPDFEIESLRAGLQLRKFEPHPYLTVGERVRIKAGALAGLEGVLLRKKTNFRVVLTLDQIMQSVAVEVDVDDLEPVTPRRVEPVRIFPAGASVGNVSC